MINISELEDLEVHSSSRGIPIIGSDKGAWLLEKVKELSPGRVLELGTANGYSGLILGSQGAELITLEENPGIAEEAKKNFAGAGVNAKVIIGDVVEKIKGLEEEFDMIFVDFEKKQYIDVLEDCIRLVRVGGVIIADNITMEGCQDFRAAVIADDRLETEIINIKDGLSYSRRIK